MSEFVMPSLGADMERGTIIQWLVKPGDHVRRGDIVVEIETEKADMEVEIFEDGVIEAILVNVGDEVPVGTPLARLITDPVSAEKVPASRTPGLSTDTRIEKAATQPVRPPPPLVTPGETAVLPAVPKAPVRATPGAHLLAERLGVPVAGVQGTGQRGVITRADIERAAAVRARSVASRPPEHQERTRVSPYARRLAAERGIDLAGMTGNGPGGSIVARDIPGSVPQSPIDTPPPSVPRAVEPEPAESRTAARQRAVAQLMARSKREIPHYYLQLPIDVTGTLAWLQRENARRPIAQRVLLPAVFLRAVVLAVREHPGVNGYFRDQVFEPSSAVHLGVAIALRDGGLVSPAILDAEKKSLEELMADLRDLVGRARAGKLRAREMSAGTITVTNLGDSGVEAVHGVIFPPQVALIGLGKPQERPWAENGMLTVRTVVMATLAGDHRVSNGHRGGLFLSAIARYLNKPEEL